MRYLLAMPILCAMLTGCATPPPVLGTFTLEPGQDLLVASDTMLHFDGVDDSRCPPGVHCIWAGRLGYRFAIRRAGTTLDSFELSPGQPQAAPAALGGRRVLLDTAMLTPPPAPGMTVAYRATLTIAPTDSSSTPYKTP